MAILKTEHKQIEVKENESLIEACMDLGVPFGCQSGLCGTCRTEVLEGMENLNPRNDKELDMGIEGNERLMCQSRIVKNGIVKIKVSSLEY
ncbi:(2Fe-2S)-binding protein [Candidatus Woesearchaeota archaeon]|nr:(2Fe-2S)-binding protein [Candidatus Woesearchaeota archaeon]